MNLRCRRPRKSFAINPYKSSDWLLFKCDFGQLVFETSFLHQSMSRTILSLSSISAGRYPGFLIAYALPKVSSNKSPTPCWSTAERLRMAAESLDDKWRLKSKQSMSDGKVLRRYMRSAPELSGDRPLLINVPLHGQYYAEPSVEWHLVAAASYISKRVWTCSTSRGYVVTALSVYVVGVAVFQSGKLLFNTLCLNPLRASTTIRCHTSPTFTSSTVIIDAHCMEDGMPTGLPNVWAATAKVVCDSVVEERARKYRMKHSVLMIREDFVSSW